MRKIALAMTPAVLLGQAGRTPFSNYVIKLYETGVISAIASSCVQLPEAPSSVVLHHCGILRLALRLSVALACGMNYLQCQYNFSNANCS